MDMEQGAGDPMHWSDMSKDCPGMLVTGMPGGPTIVDLKPYLEPWTEPCRPKTNLFARETNRDKRLGRSS